uniref:Uncharacterized protein n=1 Tax=Physcomitrium patens TaxID=3218 RepID=A0A2K1K9V9_PHYPA|nr:hypothetical protein PHYPA_009752 [Physcomitrium patens]
MTVILQPSGPRMATAFMIQSTSAHSILSYVVQSLLILGQSIAMWKVRKEKRFHLLAAWVDAITFACPSCVHLEHVAPRREVKRRSRGSLWVRISVTLKEPVSSFASNLHPIQAAGGPYHDVGRCILVERAVRLQLLSCPEDNRCTQILVTSAHHLPPRHLDGSGNIETGPFF